MTSENWVEHRRAGDRELLGWVRPHGDDVVAVDRLGRDASAPGDWLAAEEALEDRGLGWLADLWELELDDGTVARVRLVEVDPTRIVVKADDLGSVDVPLTTWTLPFPAPPALRPFAGDAGRLDGLPG